ncbi:putative endopeptidase [Paenibacillus cellulosilyticus]|uniref:Putative endopeptidase n=1 Tax=Paenibacillus cellulosilyticus TaxID=375489 RepID=A0A2V2YRQ5_9BACL|nr:M13-type metalloendopeptidase [Paenibacillus cellulosilyticus]PWV97272.1 putative endopeptidase [Paenibacillus cellulosilyticus]QKS47521.1 S-layer homology domain-containing protein [Paenibacillus cellulosilyticus]
MKSIRRSIAGLLALVLAFSIGLSQAYAANDTLITRGQLAALINETFQITVDNPQQTFSDVPSSDPNAKAIAIAVTVGYMKGKGGNKFQPNAIVTGPELAVIACNILSWKGIEASDSLADVPVWAAPYYAALDDFGLLDDLGLSTHNVTVEQANSFVATLSYVAQAAANNPYGVKQVGLKDDFYLYTNRKYLADPVIYPGYPMAGTFVDVTKKLDDTRSEIMDQLLDNKDKAVKGSSEWRAAEFYDLYTDVDARENGIDKLRPYLDELYAVKDVAGLRALSDKYWDRFNFVPFIAFQPLEDTMGDRSKYAMLFAGSSLGLGSSIYYSDDSSMKNVQKAYRSYIEQVLSYTGEKDRLSERAEAIFELEKQLAAKATPPEQMQDPKTLFTKSTWDEMKKATANSGLADLLTRFYNLPATMTVYSPEQDYIKFADSLVTDQNLQTIKDMLTVNTYQQYRDAFSEDAQDIGNELTQVLMGILPDKVPVEERAAALAQAYESQAFDKAYVSHYFSESSKKDVENIVNEIIAKYEVRLKDLTWMSDETKAKAIEKLKSISVYIGYPDKWESTLNYSFTSAADGGTLFDAMMQTSVVYESALKQVFNKPYSLDEWSIMPVMTVNAFYDPTSNSIVFPAAILQAPFYDPNASREQNLGAIGAIIGHEISHAFDINGAQYDKDGNVSNWWTDEDYAEFQKRAAQLAAELSNIEFVPDNYVNGELTLGETIADLGGLSCVLDIADDDPNADLSQVFEGFAHAFALWMPVDTIIGYLQFDPHPPGKVRVNFVLQMLDSFYKVYGITEEDEMYLPPDERVSIW